MCDLDRDAIEAEAILCGDTVQRVVCYTKMGAVVMSIRTLRDTDDLQDLLLRGEIVVEEIESYSTDSGLSYNYFKVAYDCTLEVIKKSSKFVLLG